MFTFVLISIFRFFLAISAYICIKFSVTMNFLVLDVKQPKI